MILIFSRNDIRLGPLEELACSKLNEVPTSQEEAPQAPQEAPSPQLSNLKYNKTSLLLNNIEQNWIIIETVNDSLIARDPDSPTLFRVRDLAGVKRVIKAATKQWKITLREHVGIEKSVLWAETWLPRLKAGSKLAIGSTFTD